MRLAARKWLAGRMNAACLGFYWCKRQAKVKAIGAWIYSSFRIKNAIARRFRADGNLRLRFLLQWIPACAGMTAFMGLLLAGRINQRLPKVKARATARANA